MSLSRRQLKDIRVRQVTTWNNFDHEALSEVPLEVPDFDSHVDHASTGEPSYLFEPPNRAQVLIAAGFCRIPCVQLGPDELMLVCAHRTTSSSFVRITIRTRQS